MALTAEGASTWTSVLRRGTLGRRILLWLLLLSLLPLFLSNTLGYVVSRRILGAHVDRLLASLAQTQAAHVAYELERNRLALGIIVAAHPTFLESLDGAAAAFWSDGDPGSRTAEITALLEHELREMPSFDELFVIGPGGYALVATEPERLGIDWYAERLFRASRNGPVYGVEWEDRHDTRLPVFVVANPLLDGEGRRHGVLVGTAHLENHGRFLRIPPHLAGHVEVFVVSEAGLPLFVSHAHVPLDFAKPLASPLVGAQAGSTIAYENYEGVEVLGTVVEVPGVPWSLITEIPRDLAFGELMDLRVLSALLAGVFALFLVFTVWLVARSVVSPLDRLVSAAERIRGGQLGVAVAVDRDDELGRLGAAFNEMSSELQRSDEEIRDLHAQEMRRAGQLATVGELAAGIAHEVKNPLAGLWSGLELLEHRPAGDAERASVLHQMRAQLRRIEAAVSDLLSFARPKGPRAVDVDPQQLVEHAADLIRSQADAAEISIRTRSSSSGVTIRVDPEQLTQALVNLALNGIQAMQEGGTLTLSVRERNGEVEIEVADTGEGIPDALIEKIFRPFVTTKHRGTGLGLTITRNIVERNGGRLEVESEVGVGSRFTLVLPVHAHEGSP